MPQYSLLDGFCILRRADASFPINIHTTFGGCVDQDLIAGSEKKFAGIYEKLKTFRKKLIGEAISARRNGFCFGDFEVYVRSAEFTCVQKLLCAFSRIYARSAKFMRVQAFCQ